MRSFSQGRDALSEKSSCELAARPETALVVVILAREATYHYPKEGLEAWKLSALSRLSCVPALPPINLTTGAFYSTLSQLPDTPVSGV